MPEATSTEEVYHRVSSIALAFPGAEVKLSHGSPSFHVRGKMFVVFVDDHHHDGRLGVWCKATFGEQKRRVAEDPSRFYVPPYVGVKGWVGVRLDDPRADWIDLAILVEEGWAAVAPKRLVEGGAAAAGVAGVSAERAAPMRLPKTDPAVARAALERLTAICVALPEVTFEGGASYVTFRAAKKTFAYFFDNVHGDEIIAACVKVAKGDNAKLAKTDPKRFYVPAWMGSRGWVGIRIDAARVPWKDVGERVVASFRMVAPKRLVARV